MVVISKHLRRDWKLIDDMRLSAKDDNEKKTDEYTFACRGSICKPLYGLAPIREIKRKHQTRCWMFLNIISLINDHSHHLNLFMDETGRSDLR